MIASKDQKIQDQLQALTEFKETMTQPMNTANLRFSSKDSFNRTKIISNDMTNISNLNWNSDNKFSNTTEQDLKLDAELSLLRRKYQDETSNLTDLNLSQNIRVTDQHYRNNSQVYEDEDNFSSSKTIQQLNKSYEQSNHQRKYSYQPANIPRISEKSAFIGRFISKNISSPTQEQKQERFLETEESRNSPQKETSQQVESRSVPPLSRGYQRLPQFKFDKFQPSQKEQSYYKNQTTAQTTDIASYYSNRTHLTQTDVQIANQKTEESFNPTMQIGQNLGQAKNYSSNKDQEDILLMREQLAEIKSQQRDQSCILEKIHSRFDKQDQVLAAQISKSVERISSQVESLKTQFQFQKTEEEQRYNSLSKELKDIKHYMKKRSKRHNKREIQRDPSSKMESIAETNQNNEKSYSTFQNDINIVRTTQRDQLSFINQNQSTQYSQPTDNRQEGFYERSAQFGAIKDIQESFKKQQNQDYLQQKSQSKASLPSNFTDDSYKIMNIQKEQAKVITTNDSQVYYDFQTLNQNQQPPTITYLDQYPSHQKISTENYYQNIPRTVAANHTITFNAEIDKVREESQKNMNDLKHFYEKQLNKMRVEFEQRESKLKDKMKSQIQESMIQERLKLNSQLKILEDGKKEVKSKLKQNRGKSITTQSGGNQSLNSFVTERNTQNQTINSETQSNQVTAGRGVSAHPSQKENRPSQKKNQNLMILENSTKQSDRKNMKWNLKDDKGYKEAVNLNQQYYQGASLRKKKHQDKYLNITNNHSHVLNMGTPNGHKGYDKIETGYHSTNFYNNRNQNEDKLQVKENEILRRINKIENFINRA